MKKSILFLTAALLGGSGMIKAQDPDLVCKTVMAPSESDSLLTVFPNPSEGSFQITYGSKNSCPPAGWGGTLIINITNTAGEKVFSELVEEFDGVYDRTVDLSKQQKGTYMIEIAAGTQRLLRRAILR